MIPTLVLAATLILGPAHRAADLRTGATRADERVLAIDGNRIITYIWPETTLRAVPMDDPKAATTLVTNVSNLAIPIVAPPLMAWTSGAQTHVAPIDAPDRGTAFPRADVLSMKCNATSCLAQAGDQLLLLGLDAKPYAHMTVSGRVLAADPDGFLVRRADDNAVHAIRGPPVASPRAGEPR